MTAFAACTGAGRHAGFIKSSQTPKGHRMTDRQYGAPLRAFLIHGLAGGRPFYFSGGLDVLARKLNAHGVSASVHAQGSFLRPYGEVGAIASEAIAGGAERARGRC